MTKIKKKKIVDFNEIVKNDYNLSVNNYIQVEKEQIFVNPIELENTARLQFYKKIEDELNFFKNGM